MTKLKNKIKDETMSITFSMFGGRNVMFQLNELDDRLLHLHQSIQYPVPNKKLKEWNKVVNVVVENGFIKNLYHKLEEIYHDYIDDETIVEVNVDESYVYFYFEIDEMDGKLIFQPFGLDDFNIDIIQPLLDELVVLLQDILVAEKWDAEQYPPFATGLYFTFYVI